MLRKNYLMEDALAVHPPYKKSSPADANWRRPMQRFVPRCHLQRREDRWVLSRMHGGWQRMLGCPWCPGGGRDPGRSVAMPTPLASDDEDSQTISHFPFIPKLCCRTHYMEEREEFCRQLCLASLPFWDHRFDPVYPARRAVRMAYQPDNLVQTVRRDIGRNSIQAPLPTVMVRWHVKKSDSGYTLTEVCAELRMCGELTDAARTSELSVRATFRHLSDACHAVSRKHIGRDSNPLMVLWFHRTMKNKTFRLSNRHLRVEVDPFT